MAERALIAMSGGVDSSVAAFLMKEQGYDCMGVTMKLFFTEAEQPTSEHSCCTSEDIEDARSVAAHLQMPYQVVNYTDGFCERVIQPFIQAYEKGITPNPCVECNRNMKFHRLFEYAKEMQYDYVVTGHYCSIEYHPELNRYLLKKALDPSKDQSYVLYSLTQEQLAHTRFPLGELDKQYVRAIAEREKICIARKKESQDICFVPDGKYAEFIERFTQKVYPEGDFIDLEGNVLGRHKGIIRYTVGQRKGLGIASTEPYYVASVNAKDNTVVLARDKDLFTTTLEASRLNLISYPELTAPMRLKAKIRYRHTEQPATVTQIGPDRIRVVFDEPQRAITKGQAVVLYEGDYVVGGATIDKV